MLKAAWSVPSILAIAYLKTVLAVPSAKAAYVVLIFPTTSESDDSLIEFELRAISVGASLVAAAASATPSAFAKEISPAVLPTVALAAAAT